MNAPWTLALWLAPAWDESGVEFLRVVTALVAVDRRVRLVEAGPGRGVLTGDDLPEAAERYVDALAEAGVAIETVELAEAAALAKAASALLRQAPAGRKGEPPVLDLTAGVPPDPDALVQAGQVIR